MEIWEKIEKVKLWRYPPGTVTLATQLPSIIKYNIFYYIEGIYWLID